MSGGVKKVVVRRCTFLGTDLGLRFKTTRGRGGVVENIWISDIIMKDIPTDAIGFNMYYSGGSPIPENTDTTESGSRAAAPVNEGTPQFQNIFLRNIVCHGAQRAVQIEGLPEMPIRGIELENIQISARTGLFCVDAERIRLNNVQITPATGPVISLRDSRDVTISRSKQGSSSVFLRVEGEKSEGIRIQASSFNRNAVELNRGARESAVVLQ
jgi:DNA sulfur modification protein DndE